MCRWRDSPARRRECKRRRRTRTATSRAEPFAHSSPRSRGDPSPDDRPGPVRRRRSITYCKAEAIGHAVRWKLDKCTRKRRPKIRAAGQPAGTTRTFGRMDQATILCQNDPKVGVLGEAGSSCDVVALVCTGPGVMTIPSDRIRDTTKLSKWSVLLASKRWSSRLLAELRRAAGWAPWERNVR